MKREALAILLITVGVISLLKNLNLLPEGICAVYLRLAERYWPALLVLYGIKVLFRGQLGILNAVIKYLVILAAALWLICLIRGGPEWVI